MPTILTEEEGIRQYAAGNGQGLPTNEWVILAPHKMLPFSGGTLRWKQSYCDGNDKNLYI